MLNVCPMMECRVAEQNDIDQVELSVASTAGELYLIPHMTHLTRPNR
jgi:hypothetical protein